MSASYKVQVPVADFGHAFKCGSVGFVEVGVDEAYAWFTCLCGEEVEVPVEEYLSGSPHHEIAGASWLHVCYCGRRNARNETGGKLFAEHLAGRNAK